jgi:hypothetical protein
MRIFNTCFVFIFSIVLAGQAFQQSHYNAAVALIKIVQQEDIRGFLDTIVNTIIVKKPDLKGHKDEIYKLLDTYVRSDQFRTTRINLLLRLFTEPEIRELIRQMQKPELYNSRGRQSDLLKRYRETYSYLEEQFIEYVHKKLSNRYDKKK